MIIFHSIPSSMPYTESDRWDNSLRRDVPASLSPVTSFIHYIICNYFNGRTRPFVIHKIPWSSVLSLEDGEEEEEEGLSSPLFSRLAPLAARMKSPCARAYLHTYIHAHARASIILLLLPTSRMARGDVRSRSCRVFGSGEAQRFMTAA